MASLEGHSQHGWDSEPQWPSPEEPSVARDGGGGGGGGGGAGAGREEGENVMDKLLHSFQVGRAQLSLTFFLGASPSS
jgi:hypothetical protein